SAESTGQMGTRSWPGRRWMSVLLGVMVATGAGVQAMALGRLALESGRLPLWDEAKYGVSGLRLADALASVDLVGFVTELNALSVWPPTWPVAQVLPFWVAGDGVAVPRMLAAVAWWLSIIATWWAGRGLVDRGGDGLGLLAASWILVSPELWTFATLGMLEMPGLLLLALAFGSYTRAIGDHGIGWWRATWIATTLLFFCKYNYGLLWIGPLILVEVVRRAGSWRRAITLGRRAAMRVPWRAPWTRFVIVVLGLLAVVRWTGGFDTEVLGVPLRMTSAGNPLYGLYLLVLGRLAWQARRDRAAWHRIAATLDPPVRSACVWVAAPIMLWMIVPPHVKDFVGFVENRSSGLGWVDALLFYPRALVSAYAPSPLLGWVVVAVAFVGIPLAMRGDSRQRLLGLLVVGTGLAVVAHPYKLSRFAISWSWLIAMIAALVVVVVIGRVVSRFGPSLIFAIGSVSFVAANLIGIDLDRARVAHEAWTAPAEGRAVLDHLVSPAVRLDGDVLVLGTWNDLSPWLIEWADREAQLDSTARVATDFTVGRRRAWAIRRQLDDPRTPWAAVVVVERIPTVEDPTTRRFSEETAWLAEVQPQLDSPPWRRDPAAGFSAAGYRLVVYRR
ncbi:MAG: hypothetical protein AAGE94_07010, partial [Acidobacteriota bacterium]